MEQEGPLLPSLPVELWDSIIDWVIRLQLHPWSLDKPINEGLRALLALESTCKGFRSFVLVSFPHLLTAIRHSLPLLQLRVTYHLNRCRIAYSGRKF